MRNLAASLPSVASPRVAITGFFAAAALTALLAPSLLWMLLCAAAAIGVVALVWRHIAAASALWLVLTACTLEMTLIDLIGPGAFEPTIAAVKASGLALALICAVRFGPRLDLFNPGWAYLAMFLTGLAHGLYPGLTTADSLRSLIGSAAPYAFCFSRPSRRWAQAVIRATQWAPLVSVCGGALLAVAGLRPLFVDSGGVRLAALGHPAFLASAALAACYASLIEFYRNGRSGDLAWLAANALILLLTGARAPLLYGCAVTLLTFAFVGSPAVPRQTRLVLLLIAGSALPIMLLCAQAFSDLRVFNLLLSDAGDLSGRTILWPYFEDAAARSLWLGWGIGAGNVVVPRDSSVIPLMHTWAAHNEWLRMQVEGGQIGRALLVTLFVLWTWRHTRHLGSAECVIIRLAFVAFACHALTDNVLISTSASVLFTFCAAVFARGEQERGADSD